MSIKWYCGTIVFADGSCLSFTQKEIDMLNYKGRTTPAGNNCDYDYEMKSWPWFFEPMCSGHKKHDMRDKRDRDYKVGDRVLLREYDPRVGKYTGREALMTITYITDNVTPCAMSSSALDNNHAILSVLVSELGDTDRNA